MEHSRAWPALVGVLALLVTAGAAAAQNSATVISADIDETPSDLPGTYAGTATVEIKNPQACLCRATHIQLGFIDAAWLDDRTIEPREYTVDWAEHTAESQDPGRHTETVNLSFRAGGHLGGSGDRALTLAVNATSQPEEGPHQTRDSETQLTVSLPTGNETRPSEPLETSSENGTDAGPRPDEGAGGGGTDPVPSVGIAAAVGLVTGAALLRRWTSGRRA